MPTIIKNGRNYSGTSVSLTQAEYDALPEVTKMNGTTYFITDSEVVLNAEDVALDEGNLNDLAGSVATIETSPATTNHEVGEYILWNGVLYTVISAIATGENLVINNNISTTTVGTELQTLNKGLNNIVTGEERSCTISLASTGWKTGEITTPSKTGYTLVGYLLRCNTYRITSTSYQISGANTTINAYVNSTQSSNGNVFAVPIFVKN